MPFEEHRPIVSKVDELFAICDALKGRIHEAQVTQLNLAMALVEGTVGGGNEGIKNEGMKELLIVLFLSLYLKTMISGLNYC